VPAQDKPVPVTPVPVIIDTDIGFDVDDVWALAFALRCPELDIRLITTTTGDTTYRASIVAKLLQVAGREDIPIGIGLPLDHSPKTHGAWVTDFSFEQYRGDVFRDGVGALCEQVMASSEPLSVIAIGPLPNLAAALAREPEIVHNARFVGMHGSLRRGYLGAPKPMREYNVKQHSLACQAVFNAEWEKVITPLDTCGTVTLDGERFSRLNQSESPLTRAVLENHEIWGEAVADWPILSEIDLANQSSILYDSVAIYLAFANEYLEMEELGVQVTEDGKTILDQTAPRVNCAMNWRDKDAFLDLLCERLV